MSGPGRDGTRRDGRSGGRGRGRPPAEGLGKGLGRPASASGPSAAACRCLPAAGDPLCAPCAGPSWRTRPPATSSSSSASISPSPSWSCSTASGVTGTGRVGGLGAKRGGRRGGSGPQRAGSGASRRRQCHVSFSAGPGLGPCGRAWPPGPPSGGAGRPRASGAAGEVPHTHPSRLGSERLGRPLSRVPTAPGAEGGGRGGAPAWGRDSARYGGMLFQRGALPAGAARRFAEEEGWPSGELQDLRGRNCALPAACHGGSFVWERGFVCTLVAGWQNTSTAPNILVAG